MCAQKCPLLNVQIAFKYTKISWSSSISLIYQIVNAILVGFPQAVLLDPLEIYYSSHPNITWKFAHLDPHPPGTSSNLPWGEVWIFSGTTRLKRKCESTCMHQVEDSMESI